MTHMTHLTLRQIMCRLQIQISATIMVIEKLRQCFSKKNSVFKSFQPKNTLLASLEYPQTNVPTKNYIKGSKKLKLNQFRFDFLDLDLF